MPDRFALLLKGCSLQRWWKRVSIVDIQGKVLGEYLYSGQDLLTVDIDNISKGLYFVKMETQEGTFHQKLVVQ